jgi:cell division protein FtsA
MANTTNPNLISVVDIGSAKTVAMIAEKTESGLRYRGHGLAESRGTKKGNIVDLEKASACVHHAMDRAELVCGSSVEKAVITVGGSQIKGLNSRGGIALGSRPREIGREDIRQAVERARSVVIPADRELLHLLPQEYIIDGEGAIRDPLGMTGSRLEVSIHMVTSSATGTQSAVTAANRAGVQVDDTIFEALAAAESVLRPDEREIGVALLDIGAGSTEIISFFEGSVSHTGVIPIGGDHFTNDIAVGLRTPLAEAEKIKRGYGHAVVTDVPESNEIEVPLVNGGTKLMPQRLLAEIIEPRARELFEYVRDNLRQGGVLEAIGAGLVLTGGGARLNGLVSTIDSVLRVPARIGAPIGIANLPSHLAEPEYAVALGGLMYAHRSRIMRGGISENGFRAKLRALFQTASVL